MEGPLSKWTNVMKGWQYRWFVLDDNAGLLSYYTSKEKMVRGARRGCVRLRGAVIGIDDEDDSTFTITVDGKMFHFQARDADERERWLRALEDTILRHTHSNLLLHKWTHSHHPPSVEDFDKKLTESDAYLQLLIDQIKDLEIKISKLSETEEEKHQMVNVHEKALLESIKHSIVLLQIAKNTTHPVNGVYQPSNTPLIAGETSSVKPVPITDNNTGEMEFPRNSVTTSSPQVVVESRESLSNRISELNPHGSFISTNQPPNVTALGLLVPATSYSSSDDDDFYDATEEVTASGAQIPSNPKHFEDNREPPRVQKNDPAPRLNRSNFLNSDNSINYDLIYDEDGEEELGSLEGQGSVISHLLSQVKIGMDLTKVVLPTFILERRSLLEMYADFFAHPDIFTSIPDFEDPKDRMVQVVRWYLSAFHAGRKSSVAKKPYNPILGEVFRCYWDVDGMEDSPDKVKDGPVPWAHKNNLTFVAEQVSHHPPISAFYAEHYNKGISACAHIWTKSKFLGLSIGVHNIGQGCVSVLKYDEEYILTFPNGYGRSILTVPWIELGGEVRITCSKTGYNALVNFHTKPFYGGKKHRIAADVFHPNDKKPFLSISGEWNGVMHTKNQSGHATDVFIDTKSIPIVKKRVKHVLEQEENESRRMWKDVTVALALHNVEAASQSKFTLEQRQRQEAQQRKETGVKWETKLFKELGDHWIYGEPLQSRLVREAKKN